MIFDRFFRFCLFFEAIKCETLKSGYCDYDIIPGKRPDFDFGSIIVLEIKTIENYTRDSFETTTKSNADFRFIRFLDIAFCCNLVCLRKNLKFRFRGKNFPTYNYFLR